jgi:hypothetical protein
MTNDTALTPVVVDPALPPTNTIELEFNFETMNDGTNHALFNNLVYNHPSVPAVMSALSLGENATSQEAYGPYSFLLNYGDVVDIVVKNADTGQHPLCVSSSLPLASDRAHIAFQPHPRSQYADCQQSDRLYLGRSIVEPTAC